MAAKLGRPRTSGCGTRNGYQVHWERKEPACQPCLDALAAWQRERRAKRKAEGAA